MIHTIIKLSIIVAIICLLQGCGATGPLFNGYRHLDEPQAEVIIFRPDRFRAGGESLDCKFDGEMQGTLKNAGWIQILTSPGNHKLTLEPNISSFEVSKMATTVELKPNERKVFKVFVGEMNGYFGNGIITFGSWSISEVNAESALTELTTLKQSNTKQGASEKKRAVH